tara:strand:- start:129 stop:671 length:543 start_codon:yes stop_codon:yes gene_type:complete
MYILRNCARDHDVNTAGIRNKHDLIMALTEHAEVNNIDYAEYFDRTFHVDNLDEERDRMDEECDRMDEERDRMQEECDRLDEECDRLDEEKKKEKARINEKYREETRAALEQLSSLITTIDSKSTCKDLETMQGIYRAQLTVMSMWFNIALSTSKIGLQVDEFPTMYVMSMEQILELIKK